MQPFARCPALVPARDLLAEEVARRHMHQPKLAPPLTPSAIPSHAGRAVGQQSASMLNFPSSNLARSGWSGALLCKGRPLIHPPAQTAAPAVI